MIATKEQTNDQIDSGLGDSFGSFGDSSVEAIEKSVNNLQLEDEKSAIKAEEREKIIRILRQAFTPDEDNDTYLHLFIARGLEEKAFQLIKICPQKELLNIQNNLGQTALHVATWVNFDNVAADLILNGADLEYVDKDGRNIIHICAQRGHLESLLAIIKTACETRQLEKVKSMIDERDFYGITPFYLAVSNKHESICKKLFEMKADVNLSDAKNGNSPLHEAILDPDCSQEFINFLINNCKLNVNHQNYAGITPLHCAAGKDDSLLFAQLIRNGADNGLIDISGNIPAVYGNNEIWKLLSTTTM